MECRGIPVAPVVRLGFADKGMRAAGQRVNQWN